MLSDYTICLNQSVGEGTFSVVKAFHKRTHKPAVAKIMKLNSHSIAQFTLECKILSKLNEGRNPNIIKMYTYGVQNDTGIIVMERMDEDLLDVILEKDLTASQQMDIFHQICLGIKQCHDNNIAHLDIKPENILVSTKDDGSFIVKLIDFGGAQFMKNGKVTDAAGTLHYLSPEIFHHHRVDGRKADIWSLGILMHVLSSTTWPYLPSDSNRIGDVISKGELTYSGDLNQSQKKLITTLLKRTPKRRPSIDDILGSEFLLPFSPLSKSRSTSLRRNIPKQLLRKFLNHTL